MIKVSKPNWLHVDIVWGFFLQFQVGSLNSFEMIDNYLEVFNFNHLVWLICHQRLVLPFHCNLSYKSTVATMTNSCQPTLVIKSNFAPCTKSGCGDIMGAKGQFRGTRFFPSAINCFEACFMNVLAKSCVHITILCFHSTVNQPHCISKFEDISFSMSSMF